MFYNSQGGRQKSRRTSFLFVCAWGRHIPVKNNRSNGDLGWKKRCCEVSTKSASASCAEGHIGKRGGSNGNTGAVGGVAPAHEVEVVALLGLQVSPQCRSVGGNVAEL